MRARVVTLAFAALAAGCAMGPPYQRPALDVPQNFRGDESAAAAAEKSLADLAWWDRYQDKNLQTLVRTALAQNRDVKIAAARVQEARALAGVSRMAQFPQIDANATGGRGRVFQGGEYATGDLFLAQAQVSFELDIWRRLASLNEAARANLLATQYAQEAIGVSLVGDVATAYFNLLALDDQLRITQNTLVDRQRFFDLTQSKFNRGAASD